MSVDQDISSSSPDVMILGAGITGLTTGYYLIKRGFSVTILEQQQSAGGKLSDIGGSTLFDPMIPGWYLNFRNLLKELEISHVLQPHDGSSVYCQQRKWSHPVPRKASFFPKPWFLDLPDYLQFSSQEKYQAISILTLLSSFKKERLELLDELSLRAWGVGFHAAHRPFLRHLMDPHSLHVLMASGHGISARVAATTIHNIIGATKPFISSFKHNIYDDLIKPLLSKFISSGGVFIPNCEVRSIIAGKIRAEGVETSHGIFTSKYIVSTLPPQSIQKLLSKEFLRYRYFQDISRLRTHPWASVELCLDGKVTDITRPIVYADSQLGLYLRDLTFHKGVSHFSKTVLSCTLSRYEAFEGLSDEDILKLLLEELQVMFPQVRESNVSRWILRRYNTEPHLLHTTGSWRLRPRTRSPLYNFLFAGEWVKHSIDLSCIEGAVVSAKSAVNAIFEDHHFEQLELSTVSERHSSKLLAQFAEIKEAPRRFIRQALLHTDRRKHVRVEGAIEGYIEDVETHLGWTSVLVTNFSQSGLFFVSEATPRIGARIRIRMRTHQGDHIELRAKVVRMETVRAGTADGIGIGCTVTPLDEDSQYHWGNLTDISK